MAITCPRCGVQLDVTLFAFDRRMRCDCGEVVDAASPEALELRRRGDALTWTILYSDLPRIDVDLAIEALRDWVRRRLPDRLSLFDMIWVARWDRLRAQGWEHRRPDA